VDRSKGFRPTTISELSGGPPGLKMDNAQALFSGVRSTV
jgi:hypothetical protein